MENSVCLWLQNFWVCVYRNHSNNPVLASTAVVPTTGAKGATKRSKRVAQRLANEEPAPPPLKLPKLHLVLTRKEIQEDWVKITGHKYSGKPKKSTLIQRVCWLFSILFLSRDFSNVQNCKLIFVWFWISLIWLILVMQGLGLCTALTCPSSIRYLNEPQCMSWCLFPLAYLIIMWQKLKMQI